MIKLTCKNKGPNVELFLRKALGFNAWHILERYGETGVNALASATPKDTGKTANSWSYDISYEEGTYIITWSNSNVARDYAPIAVLLDVGHATGSGGYVKGSHFIEPALKDVFSKIANDAWTEVTRS